MEYKEEQVQIKTSNKRRNFNNLKIRYKKDKKKFLVSILGLLVIISALVGSSYAYLTYISKTNSSVVINAGTLALTFQNSRNEINIENAVPISDEEGLNQEDEYSFEIKNNGSIPALYKIVLSNVCQVGNGVDKCIPDEYIKVGLKIGDNDYKVLERNNENEYVIDTGNMAEGSSNSYKMKLWLDYDTPNTYNSAGGQEILYEGKLGLTYEQGNNLALTLDANGGTIASGADWTGSGSTAVKTIFYNGTYGNLPTPTRTGYTFKGWSILPKGYKPVEYIGSSGTQYVDTGVKPTDDLSTDITYVDTSSTGDNYVLGSREDNNSLVMYGVSGSSSNLDFDISFKGESYNIAATRTSNKKYRISLTPQYDTNDGYRMHGILKDLISDQVYEGYTNYVNTAFANNVANIYVFALNSSNVHQGMKVYSLKFKKGKNLIHNYFPCIKTSTNETGLYDLIGDKFYGNEGTGSFTPGSAKYVTSEDGIIGNNSNTLTAVWEAN